MEINESTVKTTTYTKEFGLYLTQVVTTQEGDEVGLRAIGIKKPGSVIFQADSLFELEQVHQLSGRCLMMAKEALDRANKSNEEEEADDC